MLTRTTRRLLLVPVEDAGTLALLSVVTEDTESPFKVRRLVVSSPRGHSHPWPLRALSVVPSCRRLPLEIPAPLPLSRHGCCLAIDITTAIATAITAGAVTIATAITTAAVTIATTTTTTTITTAAATVSAT